MIFLKKVFVINHNKNPLKNYITLRSNVIYKYIYSLSESDLIPLNKK